MGRRRGSFRINFKDGRGDTYGVPATDHGEASEAIRRQEMGDSGGGRSTRGSGNPVVKDLHIETEGNRGAVSGATSLICGVCKGDRVQRRRSQ